MSYGAVPLSLSVSPTAVTAGGDVSLSVSSPIKAPGKLILEDESAGSAWQTLA